MVSVRKRLWIFCGGALLAGFMGAQSMLTTSYAAGECWDCAGGNSCPKSIGVIDGKNMKFPLRRAPLGAAAVDVYLNGIRLRINADYRLSGQALTLLKAPQSGDSLDVRYSGSYAATVAAQ